MIKYIQKLKAKKGFTLVELIVVIAIIGVLAAILIPVMLGYVTDSRISSVDSTASTLKDSLNTFITDMDAKNAGVKRTAYTVVCQLVVNKASGGAEGTDFTIQSVDTSAGGTAPSESGNGILLTSAAMKYANGSNGAEWIKAFEKKIGDDYNFKQATAKFYIQNGMCVGVAYYAGLVDSTDTSFTWPNANAFKKGKIANYWGDKEGIMSASGELLGTNPKLSKS